MYKVYSSYCLLVSVVVQIVVLGVIAIYLLIELGSGIQNIVDGG